MKVRFRLMADPVPGLSNFLYPKSTFKPMYFQAVTSSVTLIGSHSDDSRFDSLKFKVTPP